MKTRKDFVTGLVTHEQYYSQYINAENSAYVIHFSAARKVYWENVMLGI